MLVAALTVTGIEALFRSWVWVAHCGEEAQRCAGEAAKWEWRAMSLESIAARYDTQSKEPSKDAVAYVNWSNKSTYYAMQAREIAQAYRNEKSAWDRRVAPSRQRDYVAELWRQPD
jgi:hypothetical protein